MRIQLRFLSLGSTLRYLQGRTSTSPSITVSPNGTLNDDLRKYKRPFSFVEIRYRANVGFDMCSWRETLTDSLPGGPLRYHPRDFTHVIVLNGSVRGPFMSTAMLTPRVMSSSSRRRSAPKKSTKSTTTATTTTTTSTSDTASPTTDDIALEQRPNWSDIFLSKLGGSLNVTLVGTSVNCARNVYWRIKSELSVHPDPYSLHPINIQLTEKGRNKILPFLHIQSMFLAFAVKDMPLLLENMGCYPGKLLTRYVSEFGISREVLHSGANLAVMQTAWHKHNFQNLSETESMCALVNDYSDDAYRVGRYGTGDISPLEVIFFKNNRHIAPTFIESHSTWQLRSREWSWSCETYREMMMRLNDDDDDERSGGRSKSNSTMSAARDSSAAAVFDLCNLARVRDRR